MTLVVLFNLVLIAFVMGGAFLAQVLPDPSPGSSPQRLTPMLHGIAGAVAEGLGIYLLLLMHSLLPAPLRASNYRLLMRLTFGLWLLVFAGGVAMYVTTYAGSAPAANAPAAPAAAARPSGAGAYGNTSGAGAYGNPAGTSGYGSAAGVGASAVQPTVAPARPAPAAVTVSMTNFAFGPRELTVKAGTTVTFTNGDRAPHTATADGGQFDTGNVAPGASGTLTLSQTGTFRFFCRLHGGAGGQGMSGTVIVQP
jgi:plastocyanin